MSTSEAPGAAEQWDHSDIGYLVVRFDPDDLPTGTVNQEDLTEFQSGLQDVIEGIMRLPDDRDRSARQRRESYQLVIIRTQRGSFEVVITLQQILTLAIAAGEHLLSEQQTYEEVILACLLGGAGAVGKKAADRAMTAVDRSMTTVRAAISRLYHFLSAVMSARWDQLTSYSNEKIHSGLSRMNAIAGRVQYRDKPVELEAGTPADAQLPTLAFNAEARNNIQQFLSGQVAGMPMQAYGQVTALDRDNANFRVSVQGYNRRFECRYSTWQFDQVRQEAASDSLVIVTGTPYFRPNAVGILPPQYIRVQSVQATREDPGWRVRIYTADGEFVPVSTSVPVQSVPTLWDSDQVS